MIARIRRLGKTVLRTLGIDIRFIPDLGFDAYDDMRKIVGNDRPVIFDVGANRGQTIERIRKTFGRPVIHAFEPGRDTFAELERRTRGTPDLHLNRLALGQRAESRTFFDTDPPDMSSLLEQSVDAWGKIKDTYPVQLTTADDYCAAQGIERIDILKSDTQGFDLDVLKGAHGMIDRRAIKLILMEITFSDMYKGSPRFDEIYSWLTDRRFALVSFYDFYYQHGRAGWTDALFVAE